MGPPRIFIRRQIFSTELLKAVTRRFQYLATLGASLAILLGLLSATLLIVSSFSEEPTAAISIRYASDSEHSSPESAAAALFARENATGERIGLTPDGMFWFGLSITPKNSAPNLSIELRQLRGQFVQLWEVASHSSAARDLTLNEIPAIETRSGLGLEGVEIRDGTVRILGRLKPLSVVKPQITIQDGNSLSPHLLASDRLGGILFGGMLGLAIFGSVVALLNRDRTFFLLSALLVTSLRIAGFNYGWDLQWIGWEPNPELVPLIKNGTLLLHMVVTVALFDELFGDRLEKTSAPAVIAALYSSYSICLVLMPVLAAHSSILLIWLLGIATTLSIFFFLGKIARTDRSPVTVWYSLSWFVTGVGMSGEIANALGYAGPLIRVMNSQVAAISSAVLAGIALAAKLRIERAERISAQYRAVEALERFRENYNAMPVGIFTMKHDGTILEYNPTFGVMFSDQGEGVKLGRNFAQLAGAAAMQGFEELTTPDRMMDTELSLDRPDGRRRWFHMRGVRKSDRFEAWIEEITSRKEAEGQLNFLVDHDSLTGLLNRRGFEMHLQAATNTVDEQPACIACVDLDKFKLVNELFGHAAGDQILRQLATRMREVIHPPHVISRVGGDEFVVIINGLDLVKSEELCHELRRELSDRPYQYQDKVFTVAASVGLIRLRQGMRPADVLTASDRACSEAKRSGSGVVALDSSSSALIGYLDEIKMIAGMKERMPVENFFTQMQPIVSLRDPSKSLCYEVLIRMRDNNGQTLPPSRFIPAAERNGLMTEIDRWVLRSTLEWLDSQPKHRDEIDFCTLNLSGASLNDDRFLQDTIALILEHRESARKVCFEITESVALYDLNTTRRFVDKVKSFGARVALDDFGAGYTSFSYLKELPGDLVKIDGSFIRDVNENPANFAITRAVVELSHELGMACVAEWAENAEIVRSLMQLQVDYGQGYGLSRPLDRERLLAVDNGLALVRDQATIDLLTGKTAATADLRKRTPASRASLPL